MDIYEGVNGQAEESYEYCGINSMNNMKNEYSIHHGTQA